MTSTQEKIFQIIKDQNVSKNGVFRDQSLQIQIDKWDRRSRDEAREAILYLLSNDYLQSSDGFYQLTEKGYNYIYKDYSLVETENIILEVIKAHKVGVGHLIVPNWFTKTQQTADRFHFDNWDQAVQNIIKKGYIEVVDEKLKLTAIGYDEIY